MTGLQAHDGDGEHVHELSPDARGRLVEQVWKLENVELTTVGIDIGSSTSHLMFAGVRLQRKTQALSSQFVVVERKVLWKSPILLTPFVADGTIDAAALGRFIADSYAAAGLVPDEVDTGAVILTGEAIQRANARAIADLFAADAGRFVCASAGHHLECSLAAHGSGAVSLSRETEHAILNVDIGGGTTKLAIVHRGRVLSTCAFAVGGRLLAFDAQGRVQRIDAAARAEARFANARLALGEVAAPEDVARVVDALASVAIGFIRGDAPGELARELLLTELPVSEVVPRHVLFSGGVSEYVHGREARDFGDIARALADRVRAACDDGRIGLGRLPAREGIRATVIGASQFTVQVSGKTIHLPETNVLPLHNVPVVAPDLVLGDVVDAGDVARVISSAMHHAAREDDAPVALAIRWQGDPFHARLRALAEGIALAVAPRTANAAPLVLVTDGDIARTLGHILVHEVRLARPVVAIDGVQLRDFDYVDVGEVIRPADVVPVVIKSLLFPAPPAAPPPLQYQPVNPRRKTA